MRRLAGIGIALLLVACATAAPAPASNASPGKVQVSARAIPLYPGRPNDRRAGHLVYRGGIEIESADTRVGGLSDIAVSTDGTRVLLVSDASHWLRARLSYDAQGNLAGLADPEIASMHDLSGAVMEGKEGDAEGLTSEVAGEPWGAVLVSFERDHRVWRYDLSRGLDATPQPVPVGSWIDSLPGNQGVEAIALLPHEALLAFSEHTLDAQDDIVGALEAYPMQVGHGGYGALSLRAHESFSVTSAAPDGSGGVFILERRFSLLGGLGMEVRHVPAGEIRSGARIDGTVLANLAGGGASIDNMEGLAARRDATGKTFLYVISDDNFSPMQRTVLLMFEVAQ